MRMRHTHVQATRNAGTLERLVGSVLLPDGHQTGHLDLSELNLPAPEGSEGLENLLVTMWTRQWPEEMLPHTMSATLKF
mgnify:CR=1 FL=1